MLIAVAKENGVSQMSRISVIDAREMTHALEAGRRRDCKNDIAQTFGKQMAEILGERFLPGQFGISFHKKHAELYVSQRTLEAGVMSRSPEFSYEESLHRLCCPLIADDDPLLIISGREGIGKSTFLRYYFDCYLANLDEFPALFETNVDREQWEQELSKQVVFYVNLRHSPNKEVTKDKMLNTLRRKINHFFQDISVENDYAMWDRVADWNNPLHERSERTFSDRSTYRCDYTHVLFKDNEQFVREALWYLSKQRNGEGLRKYYITLILDDLDQLNGDIQEYVVELVLEWLGDKIYYNPPGFGEEYGYIDLWRVILPLRPETARSLMTLLGPIERKHVLQIGTVNESLLLQARADKLKREIRLSTKQVESDIFIEKDNVTVYLPLPASVAAERMGGMLTYDYAVETSRDSRRMQPGAATQEFMSKFCNGSIRRFLALRKRLANSIAIEHAVKEKVKYHPEVFWIPRYAFIDSILTGGRDHFDEIDPDNNILNLYNAIRQPASPHTLLIGPHLLHMLRQKHYAHDELVETLTAIGYMDAEVEDCLISMFRTGIIKYVRGHPFGDLQIDAEKDIVDAYFWLLTDNAYIDNMAIVTPVIQPSLRNMRRTVSYRRDDFKARVMTSLSFLRQIRDDEYAVRTWTPESPRHAMDPKEFKKRFDDLCLPSIYQMAAIAYRSQLQTFSSRYHLYGVMTSSDWDELLGDEILHVNSDEAKIPLKGVTP